MGAPLNLPDTLSDGVIQLDRPTIADADAHVAGEDREMRLRFESPNPDTPATSEHTRGVFAGWIAARAAGGPKLVYALRDGSGQLVGGCEMRRVSEREAAVSYWVYPAFRRRGFGARALTLLCAAALETPGLKHLVAHIDADNLASRRTAERAGLDTVGVVEDRETDGSPRPD